MEGVRTAEEGEGVAGAMIRARIRVDGRLADGPPEGPPSQSCWLCVWAGGQCLAERLHRPVAAGQLLQKGVKSQFLLLQKFPPR